MRLKLYNIEKDRWTNNKAKSQSNGYILVNPCELLFTYGSSFKDIFDRTEPFFFQLKGRQIIAKGTVNQSVAENLLQLAIDTGNKPLTLNYDVVKDIIVEGKLGIQYELDEFCIPNIDGITLYK